MTTPYFLPPEVWCSVVFVFLSQKSLIPLLWTSREWKRLAYWASSNTKLRVPEDISTIALAIKYAQRSLHRIQHIQIGPGIWSLPVKPPPPSSTGETPTTTSLTLVPPPTGSPPLPTSTTLSAFPIATNILSAGITIKSTSKLIISGTISIGKDGLTRWKTTVLGQWDLISCSDITVCHLRLQSQNTGICCLSKCNNIQIIHCSIEFCKKKGIVFRSGSKGSIDASTISNNLGFAGILVHGHDTFVELSRLDVYKNKMAGIWVCGSANVLLPRLKGGINNTISITKNDHYGIRIGFQARFIGSGGTIVKEKGCQLNALNNKRANIKVENGGTLVELKRIRHGSKEIIVKTPLY